MATIVANQPYREPWGARLAESFLTDLLLGGIQRGRAATASKREGEYMAQLAAQRQQGGLAPEAGYFDVNPLNPMNPDAVPAPDMVRTPGKMPSLGDAFTLKASDPRFAGISVDRTYDMVNPLYQSWQKEDELARRQAYAAEIAGMSPEDPGFLSNLVGGHVQGFVDPSVVGHGQNMYEHMNPHKTLNTVNTGDAMTGYAFDPGTGGVEELFRQAMGQSPDSRAATGARYAELSESRRRYDQEYADRKKDETFLRSQQVPEGADAQRAMIIENLLTGRTSPQAGTAIGGLMYPKTGARTGGRDYSVLTPAERLKGLENYYNEYSPNPTPPKPLHGGGFMWINNLYCCQ
jgi:hypothetical protein